jgi:hypothetical protein
MKTQKSAANFVFPKKFVLPCAAPVPISPIIDLHDTLTLDTLTRDRRGLATGELPQTSGRYRTSRLSNPWRGGGIVAEQSNPGQSRRGQTTCPLRLQRTVHSSAADAAGITKGCPHSPSNCRMHALMGRVEECGTAHQSCHHSNRTR